MNQAWARLRFLVSPLLSIEQSGEKFFLALVKSCTGPVRFSLFRSKMDDITGAEQL